MPFGALETSPVAAQVMPSPVSPSKEKSLAVKTAIIFSQTSAAGMSAVIPAFWQAS